MDDHLPFISGSNGRFFRGLPGRSFVLPFRGECRSASECLKKRKCVGGSRKNTERVRAFYVLRLPT
jgi:hypothetical protein